MIEQGKVTQREKVLWGIGGLPETYFNWGIQQLMNPIYNIALGLNPALIGLALSMKTIWDAVSDPLMGYVSDKTQTRWGRRRPFMLVGILLAAFGFVSIWWAPQGISNGLLFAYLLVTLLFTTTAATVYMIPYLGLGYSLTMDVHEKTSVQAYRAAGMKIAAITVPWLYYITTLDFFDSTIEGVRTISVVIGILVLIAGLTTVVGVKERKYVEVRSKVAPPKGFFRSICQIFNNWTIVLFFLIILLLGQSTQVVNSLSLYVMIYYMFEGNEVAAAGLYGIGNTVFFVLSLAAIPATVFISRKFGKLNTFRFACLIVTLASVGKWFFFNADYPWLVFLVYALMAPGLASFYVLRSSMVGDLIDHDEWRNGTRRDAMLAAADQWIFKAAVAISLVISGLILEMSGFKVSLGAQQDPQALRSIRILFTVIPATGAFAAFLLSFFYPLTDAKLHAIRKELDQGRDL